MMPIFLKHRYIAVTITGIIFLSRLALVAAGTNFAGDDGHQYLICARQIPHRDFIYACPVSWFFESALACRNNLNISLKYAKIRKY